MNHTSDPVGRAGLTRTNNVWNAAARTAAVFLAVAATAPAVIAANTWDGEVSTAWGTGANWDDGNVPASGADLAFPGTDVSNFIVDLGGVNRDVRSMTFSNSSGTDYVFQNGTLRTTTRNIDFLINNGSDDVIVNAALTWTSQNNTRRIAGTGTGDVYLNGSITGDMNLRNDSGGNLVYLYINGDNSGWSGNNAGLRTSANNNVTLGHANALGSGYLIMSGGHDINASTNINSNGALTITGGSNDSTITFSGSDYSFASGTVWERRNRLAPQSNTVTIRGEFVANENIYVNGNADGKVVLNGNVRFLGDKGATWTRGTYVEGGTLFINGNQTTDIAENWDYAVSAGATLGGTGNLQGGGMATISGTLAPGQSTGTLTFGSNALTSKPTDLTFETGSTFAVELAAAGMSDKLVVAGDLTINGGTLDLALLSGQMLSRDYTLATFASRNGTFPTVKYAGSTVGNPTDLGAIGGTHNLLYDDNSITLMASPVGTVIILL